MSQMPTHLSFTCTSHDLHPNLNNQIITEYEPRTVKNVTMFYKSWGVLYSIQPCRQGASMPFSQVSACAPELMTCAWQSVASAWPHGRMASRCPAVETPANTDPALQESTASGPQLVPTKAELRQIFLVTWSQLVSRL